MDIFAMYLVEGNISEFFDKPYFVKMFVLNSTATKNCNFVWKNKMHPVFEERQTLEKSGEENQL